MCRTAGTLACHVAAGGPGVVFSHVVATMNCPVVVSVSM
jgi:hypothetical protein